jgi:ribonuclease HII
MEKGVFAGIDEAGRGAVIGPLVIAGVSLEPGKEKLLNKLGVKDSKLLSPSRREALAKKIEGLARDIVVLKLSACRIDNLRKEGVNLNTIEAMKMADVLGLLGPAKAYIDCPDTSPERMRLLLDRMVRDHNGLVVEHRADSRYPIVSAASIIAKVARDREVGELRKEWGDFGPGYSSNKKTMAWLRNWMVNKGEWPDIVRKSWSTAREIEKERGQKGIADFLKKLIGRKEECKVKK